jgi:hypothetical protein
MTQPNFRYDERYVDQHAATMRAAAISVIERINKAQVLGMIFQDSDGVFVQLLPGEERQIAEFLSHTDWDAMWRFARDVDP